ncbi:MAG: SRPBCC family protein [bacterium]
MKEYVTSSTIAASPERVWAVLADAESYSQWNPEIIGITGHFARDARIGAKVRLGDGAVRSVSQRVVEFDPPRRMTWVGGLPLGLFVGRRTFTVAAGPNGAEFQMHLHMSGPLSGMILKSVGDRQPEIDRFAAALKARAESP